MANRRYNRRKERALKTLEEKGVLLCALGLVMLLLPFFVGKSPSIAPLLGALRPVGGLALIGGVVLLAINRITKGKSASIDSIPQFVRHSIAAAKSQAQMDIKDAIAHIPKSPYVQTTTAVPTPSHAPRWSPEVFAAIEWRRFEAVCEKLFGQAGFETQSQSHGADGGVDIWLHSRNAEGPVAVVQCKHWQGKAVGVKEVREFYGVMASHKLARGTYATTSTYTADAQQFAKDNGINALDGKGLLALIAKRTPEQQQELLDVAYEGDYWRPTCASCGIKLVERTPTKGGTKFWGCSNYPKCKSRLPMTAARRS